ncbi:MAG: ABC transporter ATP-binding protein [Romboutsia sp.]
MSYVDVININKSFNDLKVLKGISFSIEKGEFLTLLGPSGCGKSTLLRTIAGLNEFDSGSIVVDNKNISNEKPKDRQVGMVFQSYALFPNMTVFENIAFGLKMKKLSKEEINEKVRNIIKIVDLGGKENNYPTELSGGQQQRVALARSIVTEPKILLLDEPLSALDAKIRKNLQREIRNIQQRLNITTIFVTHDQEEAMTMSDKIIVMDKGTIAQQGRPDEIYKKPANEFVARFIGNYNVLECQDASNILGESINNNIAVRPEVINIAKSENVDKIKNHYIKVIVNQTYMIGSILRIETCKNDIKLLIDTLNQENKIEKGMELVLEIPKKDIIYLDRTDTQHQEIKGYEKEYEVVAI